MCITASSNETGCLIRLEGQATLGDAGELQRLLVEWLGAGPELERKPLEMDLEGVQEVDITILQLLAVAGREAARTGQEIVGRASAAVMAAVRDAGFDQAPGFPMRVGAWVKQSSR